jgi:hypothetical protein
VAHSSYTPSGPAAPKIKRFIYGNYGIMCMAADNVTIPKKEYQRLKRAEKTDRDLVKQLISSLEDVKAGKIKRVA